MPDHDHPSAPWQPSATAPPPAPTAGTRWVKATRSHDALELIRANHHALVVAYFVAMRARWRTGFHADGLDVGEALIGDFAAMGLTRQEYRTALANLTKWNFLTIRTTNKGTIAKLTDSRLYDISPAEANQQNNQRLTTSQPPDNHQPTNNVDSKTEILKEKTLVECPAAAGPVANQSESEWLASLKGDAAYQGIDVEREHARMANWCAVNHKQATRRRFVNWLNRCDRPMESTPSQPDFSKGF